MHREVCPQCEGEGKVYRMLGSEVYRCPVCWGAGVITTEDVFTFQHDLGPGKKEGTRLWSFCRPNDPIVYLVDVEEK